MGALLEGKVAIVTGASRGIGACAARAFADAGAAVVLAARNEGGLQVVTADIEASGGQAIAIPADVSDEAAVRALVEKTLAGLGRLDVAFNNAGGGHRPVPVDEVAPRDFEHFFDINLRGTFLSLKEEIPAMLRSGGGAILNMASVAALRSDRGMASYVSAKHGVIGLTKAAALDYAEHGIRVNAIAPGPVLSDRLRDAGPDAQRQAASRIPMRRITPPEEIAAAAVWLCSDLAASITGVVVPIDGGMSA